MTNPRRISEPLARALSGFLVVPALIVVGFLALVVLVDRLDNHAGEPADWGPVRAFLGQYAGDTQSAVGLLSAVAGPVPAWKGVRLRHHAATEGARGFRLR